MSALELKGVTKTFGGLKAVSDVTFSVPEGSIFGLIGPNGAGKTTVFNLVTGVYKPDVGSIHAGSVDVGPLAPSRIARLGIARTFQNIRLFGQLTVLENVLVACENKRKAHLGAALLRSPLFYRDEEDTSAKALELLKIFDLDKMADETSTSLSYGNQRRLEIARAMMLSPKILLLDEPAAGMNYGEAEGLKKQIRWLREKFEITVVLVEHNMQVVMGVCEDIHVLDHGETIAHGTPEAIRKDPKVLAAYLGEEVGEDEQAEGGYRDPAHEAPKDESDRPMLTAHPTRSPPAAKPGTPLLSVEDLAVSYGGIRALKAVSLEVRRGEIVAMIGANGAGKTTTLKTIVRLLAIAGGRIVYDGKDLEELGTEDVIDAGIALVPEGRAIFPDLTVRENLELGAYNHKNTTTIAETIADVVRLFPRLGERMKQEGGTLSGGEQQMLAIGRALMARPAMLLLDEPSLGIAPRLVADIFEAIARIAEAGTTILLVEQNTRLALKYSARAYVLRTGEIAMSGASKELAENEEIRAAYLGG